MRRALPPRSRQWLLVLAGLLLPAFAASRVRADGGASPPAPAPAPVPAPTPSEADDDRAEQVERHATKGLAAFRKGNHEECLVRMQKLAKLDPDNPLPRLLTARVYARTGKYAEALALATEAVSAHPDDQGVEALRFDLLRRLGRDADAEVAAAAALSARGDDLVARTVQGLLLEDRGRREEALAAYDAVVKAYNDRDPKPAELSYVALAALHATRLSTNPADDMIRGAAGLLKRRIEADPDDVDALLVYADLYQSNRGKDGQATAGKYYGQILNQNPSVPEARVGEARIALVFYQKDRAVQECERALVTNPAFVPAMNLLAEIHVADGDYEKADEMWKKAAAVNPADKEARAIHASRLLIAGDKAGFAAIEKRLLAENPTYGTLYQVASDLVGERQRRYDVAAEFAEKAISTDPTDDQAYVGLATNLMNLGREDEAMKRLEQAVEVSKRYADVTRDNYLEVLGVLKAFVTTKTEHFVVKQHVEEAAVMEPYLLPLLEEAWKDLSAKYGVTPDRTVLVESFHRHDDFSVRSVGSPGFPATGVCFGKVITLDGPFAHGVGETFTWARTAWHEFAHVITLQMSKGQVPRWLTEGLSVHEEAAHKRQWGREMDRDLFDRWKNGRLLKMADINHAFHGPDVMFAYFEGGLIADYVKATWGFDAVKKMLVRYGDDVPTEKVFEEVLRLPLAQFDEKFAAYVGTLVSGYKMVPRWDAASKKAFEERTRKDPGDAEAWTRLAWALEQRGLGIDAGAALEKARALTPDAPDVLLLEGTLAEKGDRRDVAKERYDKFLATGSDDIGARLFLAKYALAAGNDSEGAVRQFEAAKKCFPRFVGDGNPYVELSKLYEAAGKPDKAIAEVEAYADIAQESYGARKRLAAWYEEKKDDAALIRVSQEMIEISPFGANRGKKPDLDLHARFAKALLRQGRKEEAAREWRVQTLLLGRLEEPERLKAGAVEARLALGAIYLDLKRPAEALEQALAALGLAPDSVAARALEQKAREAGADK